MVCVFEVCGGLIVTVAGPLKENRPGGLDIAGGKREKSGDLDSLDG